MKHKVRITILDTKVFPDLQQHYCANPCPGKCPCYNKGDEFVFYVMKTAMIIGISG